MTLPSADRQTYSVAEIAQLLGISRGLAYAQAQTGAIGDIPVLRVGKRLLLSKDVADRVLRGERIEAGISPSGDEGITNGQ